MHVIYGKAIVSQFYKDLHQILRTKIDVIYIAGFATLNEKQKHWFRRIKRHGICIMVFFADVRRVVRLNFQPPPLLLGKVLRYLAVINTLISLVHCTQRGGMYCLGEQTLVGRKFKRTTLRTSVKEAIRITVTSCMYYALLGDAIGCWKSYFDTFSKFISNI